jgi:hypothetical protein
MTLHDFSNLSTPVPPQLVFDTSFLLALRPDDDNPHAAASQAFARRLRPCIAALESVAWLMMPVIQECYHIILTGFMRRAWQNQDPATRPANWLALYKRDPAIIQLGLPELDGFDTLLATIPMTWARLEDQINSPMTHATDERLRYYIARYHLLPSDALILVEAERLGVRAVATLDSDWRRVAEFDIYTIL